MCRSAECGRRRALCKHPYNFLLLYLATLNAQSVIGIVGMVDHVGFCLSVDVDSLEIAIVLVFSYTQTPLVLDLGKFVAAAARLSRAATVSPIPPVAVSG